MGLLNRLSELVNEDSEQCLAHTWALVIMLIAINIIVTCMTLKLQVWGLTNDTQREVSRPHFWESVSVYPLTESLFFFSQGIPFVVWRSDIGRRNYSSWDVFALIFVWVLSYFPQGFHVQFLCALCMLWCALLPHRWLTLHSLLPGHRCYFARTARELNAQELTSWSSP